MPEYGPRENLRVEPAVHAADSMKPEEKVVFAVSPRGHVDDDDGTFDVLLGVPLAAWEYMKDGKTHIFDLTKLGLPVRILLYGGPTNTGLAWNEREISWVGHQTESWDPGNRRARPDQFLSADEKKL